jgi:Tfp pilus assembly protein PilW
MLKERVKMADERGTTLAELVVGMAVGMIVLTALTMVMIVSLHASARVSARVHATQNARISLAKVIEQLHSACLVPKVAPIQAGSTGTLLNFSHAPASEGTSATALPVRSEILLSGTKLIQIDYPSLGTTPPSFAKKASGEFTLATNLVPTAPKTSIFSYYSYSKGKLVQVPQTELGVIEASSVIQVKVAFTGLPTGLLTGGSTSDKNVGASVENSAMLRLTPPSFREGAASPPCQ